jgi:ABC-type glycerol-3-phosphate transport system substrate-binding protein
MLIAFIMLPWICCFSVDAEPAEINPPAAQQTRITGNGNDYGAYYSTIENWEYSTESIEAENPQTDDFEVGDTMSFQVTIPEGSLYEIHLEYRCKKEQNIIMEMKIDEMVPFSQAERLTFPAYWVNGELKTDKKGNEYVPEQLLYRETVVAKAQDYTGRYENPYLFGLSAGEHTITLTVVQGVFELYKLILSAPEQPQPYQAVQTHKPATREVIVIEGESASLKNDRSLIPMSDASSPMVNPSSPVTTKLNYIGGSNWKTPCSAVSWTFTVETEGYYSIGFHYRQNRLLNGISYRHLTIDGQTPFEQARRIKFKYDPKWKYMTYSDGKEPYLIYLSKGKHILTLTATAGAMSEIYSLMQDVTMLMGDLYVDITMVVGETVDIYRSYELFNQIPKFNERLEQAIQELEGIINKLEALQEQNSGSTVSNLRNAVRVIRQMRENPYSAHRYKSSFYDSYTNLSALMADMVNTPLDIDRIILTGSDAEPKGIKVSLFEKIKFFFKRLISTFSSDYNAFSGGESQEPLTIWVNWGRDQAQTLNALIQDGFVRDYGIGVNISVVNASLIQGILAGDGPDCLLHMARTEPVNFAMRGALQDLSQFEDLEKVLKRFNKGAAVPYTYNGKVYALPDTQSFYMMFIRTDIFKSLGLEIPETWDDYIDIATILQRNNLQAYLPYTQITNSGTVNTGVGGLTIYPTLLIQNGLELYNSEHTASMLTGISQIRVFNKWVSWHTKYKIPTVMDFYNRFRIGIAPIGIAPYTLYTQLKAAAPEIDGRWTMTQIPGTKREDGTVNHSSAGSGTGCAITILSKKPDNAWKFLKWWTSEDTQLKYSNSLESLLGPLGRAANSNISALSKMDWDPEILKEILNQLNQLVEIPEVPGGYYTARAIDQAFWSVVEQNKNPTEMLTKWGAVVDREIARKRAEYIDVGSSSK